MFGKDYPTPQHEEYRRKVYEQNCDRINRENLNPTRRYTRKITRFSDLKPS